MDVSDDTAPLGSDRKLLTSTDTQGFAGIRYVFDDTESWDDNFVWKD